MKSFIQFVAGGAAMCLLAPFVFETPFNHWAVFVPVFLGTMYGVAVLQHFLAHRLSSRRMVVTPGAKASGVPKTPI